MKRTVSCAVVVAAIVSCVVPLVTEAQPAHQRGAGVRIAHFLDLSDDQIAAWKELRDTHVRVAEPLREEQRASAEQLRSLLRSESPDARQAGDLLIRVHQLRKELRAVHAAYVEKFTAMLSPSQRRAYEKALEERERRGIGRALRHARIVPPLER